MGVNLKCNEFHRRERPGHIIIVRHESCSYLKSVVLFNLLILASWYSIIFQEVKKIHCILFFLLFNVSSSVCGKIKIYKTRNNNKKMHSTGFGLGLLAFFQIAFAMTTAGPSTINRHSQGDIFSHQGFCYLRSNFLVQPDDGSFVTHRYRCLWRMQCCGLSISSWPAQ